MNGPILLEKAHEFAMAFNYKDFTASLETLEGKVDDIFLEF